MARIVNVHYVDKEAFFGNNGEFVDDGEKVMVFTKSPTFVEVVARVREVLKWPDPGEKIELDGRYFVGSGHRPRKKKIPITCELDWGAYKEVVAASEDKSLELFATKVGGDHLDIDLNRCASLSHDTAVEINDMSQPPLSQQIEVEMTENDQVDEANYVNVEHALGNENEDRGDEDMEDDSYEREDEYHDNDIGNVEAQVTEEGMDRDRFYQRAYVSDSDDEGPEELDEDGFTEREAQVF